MNQPFLTATMADPPKAGDPERVELGRELWAERVAALDDADLRQAADALMADPKGRALIEGLFANSPFLTRCLLAEIPFFARLLERGPEPAMAAVVERLKQDLAGAADQAGLMRDLRIARRQVALLVAVADITGHWRLERVTEALSDFADAALSATLSHLLRRFAEKGDLVLANQDAPEEACGYAILAMGKHGARELNYSSDIDLIVIYDPMKIDYRGTRGLQHAMLRITRDLVTIMEQRTAEGYVCRTDLRLRPDPGSTPAAIPYAAALSYYQSRGKNWERAAMIKARPAAGDLALGRQFLAELRPFIWHEQVDYWALREIQSIKRQINALRGSGEVAVLGQNIKLGRGGIREIEFFAQTQQLVFGGRDPYVRCQRTVDALSTLAEAGFIDFDAADDLTRAYEFLRELEHRLQMVDDQQTQTLPDDEAELSRLADFMAFDDIDAFQRTLLDHMRLVERQYTALMEDSGAPTAEGDLEFAGREAAAKTLDAIAALGFSDPAATYAVVHAWLDGRPPATRDERSRSLLDALVPALLEASSKSPDPEAALARFDAYLSGLPAGVQLFSMLAANPALLDLLVEIVGTAPALAKQLNRRPGLLAAVLSRGFHGTIPDKRLLKAEFAEALRRTDDLQDGFEAARRWAQEQRFQIQVNTLRHRFDVSDAGWAHSHVADVVLQRLYGRVAAEVAQDLDLSPEPDLAVVVLGALGARETTPASKLQLLFLYDDDRGDESHPRYLRLTRRFVSALTAETPSGCFYAADMSVRPSGNRGPFLSSLTGFVEHHRNHAETWQLMALCQARVVIGPPALAEQVAESIRDILTAPRDPDALLADVAALRAHGGDGATASPWDLDKRPGGLRDLACLTRYLELRHAAEDPGLLDPSLHNVLAKLAQAGLIEDARAKRVIEAAHLLGQLRSVSDLAAGGLFDEGRAPEGLAALLARAGGCSDLTALKERLGSATRDVLEAYHSLIEAPASA